MTARRRTSKRQRAGALHDLRIDPETNKFAGSGAPIPSRGLQNTRQPRGRLQGRILVVGGMTTRTGIFCERAEKIAQRTWRGQRHADSTRVRREASTRGSRPPHRQGLQEGVTPHTEGGKGGAMEKMQAARCYPYLFSC